MKVITSGLKKHHRFDYVALVRDLLRRVRPEHLAGIACITVSGDRPIEDDDDVLGQYFERYERDPAVIVVYLETMAREVPRWLRPFRRTWRILLAQTLYHEIGHHYQRFSHGYAKTRQEDHAEAYGDRMSREAFPGTYRWIDRYRAVTRRWSRVMIQLLTWKVKLFPLASTHYDLGRRWWEFERWDQVIPHFEEALRLDPGARGVARALREARAERAREHRHLRAAHAYAMTPARLKHQASRRRGGRRKKSRRHAGQAAR